MRVDDYDLIRVRNRIVSDVGYRQLDLIRYMRNFASAAHPNQNEIGSMQLLGWVQTCIKEVITLPQTTVVAEIKRLLQNVKTIRLDAPRAAEIANFFDDLRSFRRTTSERASSGSTPRSTRRPKRETTFVSSFQNYGSSSANNSASSSA